ARGRPQTVRRPRLRPRAAHAQLRRTVGSRPRRPRTPYGRPARPRPRAREAVAVRPLRARVTPRREYARTSPAPRAVITAHSVRASLTAWPRQVSLDGVFPVPSVDQLASEIPAGTPLEQLATASEIADRLRARG